MSKYYRVIKEHPVWELGAILHYDDDEYAPISDVWNKFDEFEGLCENVRVVELSPDYFERVYPIGDLKKRIFGNRTQAKAAADAMFKE